MASQEMNDSTAGGLNLSLQLYLKKTALCPRSLRQAWTQGHSSHKNREKQCSTLCEQSS